MLPGSGEYLIRASGNKVQIGRPGCQNLGFELLSKRFGPSPPVGGALYYQLSDINSLQIDVVQLFCSNAKPATRAHEEPVSKVPLIHQGNALASFPVLRESPRTDLQSPHFGISRKQRGNAVQTVGRANPGHYQNKMKTTTEPHGALVRAIVCTLRADASGKWRIFNSCVW